MTFGGEPLLFADTVCKIHAVDRLNNSLKPMENEDYYRWKNLNWQPAALIVPNVPLTKSP